MEEEDELIVSLIDEIPENNPMEQVDCTKDDNRSSQLQERFFRLPQNFREELVVMLQNTDCIAWTLKDLSPSDVPVKHYFELTDDTSIHHRKRRMAPKHNDFVRK